jgi:hypothetical protein
MATEMVVFLERHQPTGVTDSVNVPKWQSRLRPAAAAPAILTASSRRKKDYLGRPTFPLLCGLLQEKERKSQQPFAQGRGPGGTGDPTPNGSS